MRGRLSPEPEFGPGGRPDPRGGRARFCFAKCFPQALWGPTRMGNDKRRPGQARGRGGAKFFHVVRGVPGSCLTHMHWPCLAGAGLAHVSPQGGARAGPARARLPGAGGLDAHPARPRPCAGA